MAAGSAQAVKAYPFPFTVHQPDGTPISVRMIGDERFVFHETEDGYTIMRRHGGWWFYADPVSDGADALAPSRLRAGVDPVPAGWPRHVRPRIDPHALSIPFKVEHDGSIDVLDVELLAANWGSTADWYEGGAWQTSLSVALATSGLPSDAVDAVPEPSSLALTVWVLIGVVVAARRRWAKGR